MPLTKAIRSTFWGAFDLDIPDRVLLYGDDYLSTYTLPSNKKRSFPKPKTFLQPQIKARVPFPKNQMTTHHLPLLGSIIKGNWIFHCSLLDFPPDLYNTKHSHNIIWIYHIICGNHFLSFLP